jgi:hypothetical protein
MTGEFIGGESIARAHCERDPARGEGRGDVPAVSFWLMILRPFRELSELWSRNPSYSGQKLEPNERVREVHQA